MRVLGLVRRIVFNRITQTITNSKRLAYLRMHVCIKIAVDNSIFRRSKEILYMISHSTLHRSFAAITTMTTVWNNLSVLLYLWWSLSWVTKFFFFSVTKVLKENYFQQRVIRNKIINTNSTERFLLNKFLRHILHMNGSFWRTSLRKLE
jgi:hypothetical protein